jgi:hypothetical protein
MRTGHHRNPFAAGHIRMTAIDQGLLQSLQVGLCQRLVGPEPVNDDVVEVVLEILLHLLLVLDAGHLRHEERCFVAHAHDLVPEVGVDDLARSLV